MNYGVLDTCYGTEVATHIGYNPVSCSGTVMGSRDGVLAYVSIDVICIYRERYVIVLHMCVFVYILVVITNIFIYIHIYILVYI